MHTHKQNCSSIQKWHWMERLTSWVCLRSWVQSPGWCTCGPSPSTSRSRGSAQCSDAAALSASPPPRWNAAALPWSTYVSARGGKKARLSMWKHHYPGYESHIGFDPFRKWIFFLSWTNFTCWSCKMTESSTTMTKWTLRWDYFASHKTALALMVE